jgi:putative holliday junction resolvase
MRAASIDYGRARIGMAMSDPEGLSVRGLPTVDRRRIGDPVAHIADVLKREAAEVVVVGLALGSDDGETAMSREAREFAQRIHAATGLPLAFVDESYSSVEAHERLRFRKRSERQRKDLADRIAACLILETYLREKGLA